MFNEEMFQRMVEQAVMNALSKQDKPEFEGFWDSNDFKAITNISEWDYRNKVLLDKDFQKCIRRFEGSRKIYIDVAKAKEFLEKNMEVGL